MAVNNYVIKLKKPYSLKTTALSHGWINLCPFYWDSNTESIERIEKVNNNTYHLQIIQRSKKNIEVKTINRKSITKTDRKIIMVKVRRLLGYTIDLKPFIALLKNNNDKLLLSHIERGGGYFIRGSTLFEDITKTILTCNANWTYTQKMVNNLCSNYGQQCDCCEKFSFPEINDLMETQIEGAGYRGKIIEEIIFKYIKNKSLESYSSDELHDLLLSIQGIGPYTAHHILFLNGCYRWIPIDREVSKYLGYKYNNNNIKRIEKEYQSIWGEHSFLAYKLMRIIKKTNWIGE